jgi:hypothetical protein
MMGIKSWDELLVLVLVLLEESSHKIKKEGCSARQTTKAPLLLISGFDSQVDMESVPSKKNFSYLEEDDATFLIFGLFVVDDLVTDYVWLTFNCLVYSVCTVTTIRPLSTVPLYKETSILGLY